MNDIELSNARILLVDDDVSQRKSLARLLQLDGFEVDDVDSGEEALERLRESSYTVLLTDLRLGGMDGLEVIRQARALDHELGILLITAYASVESAVKAMRLGAHDYLLKPILQEDVTHKIRQLIKHRSLQAEVSLLRRALSSQKGDNSNIVATSEAMQAVLAWVKRASRMPSNVLITGETGVGKEVIARAIHDQSAHCNEPFLPINIAAMPEEMVAGELFGHERGAFTGAANRRDGILRAAGQGTVFLDEIGELSMPVQAKLLRAIEAREVRPLGRDVAVPFRARVLAATHRDLSKRVEEGTFREDLFYRLNVIQIHIAPLRERLEDIPPLVELLLKRHAHRIGMLAPPVSAEAMRALCHYPWRGNVRELSNVLERALILADEGRINPEHLPRDVLVSDAKQSFHLKDAVARFERVYIAMVLRMHDGNREAAAKALDLSQATLYRRLEKLGLKGFQA